MMLMADWHRQMAQSARAEQPKKIMQASKTRISEQNIVLCHKERYSFMYM